MPQVATYAVADGSGLSVREAMNAVFSAIQSSNSGTTAPGTPEAGEIWCNTSATPYAMEVYDGANWWVFAYLENNGVWAVVEPQADLRYLKLAGGTLTGPLAGTSASFVSLSVNGISAQNATLFTTGQVAPPQLGTGTPSSATVLLGTGAWTAATFALIGGQVANGQVPVGAVTQWQGSLSIGWGQITGTKNADELQGYTVATTATANTVALRDGGGNLWTTYFNQSSANGENPSISQVMVTNGSDGYLRKAGIGYFQQSLSIAWGQLTGTKNADELQGYTVNTGGVANSIALRDSGGGLTAATFNVSSDVALKKNVRPITDALSRLDSLFGVTFDMLRPGDSTRAGVIAQHVRAALPEAVRGKDKLTVDPMGVIGLLVAALKEETAARRALEARMSRIERTAP